MYTLFAFFKIILVFVFIIPALIISAFVSLIVPPILTFIGLTYLAIVKKSATAHIYNFLLHSSFVATYFAALSNPGTDDSFSGLADVFNSAFFSSFFAFLALIFFVLYFVSIIRSEIRESQLAVAPKVEEKKGCLHCGTMNDKDSSYCSKCGMRIS